MKNIRVEDITEQMLKELTKKEFDERGQVP